MLQRHMMAQMLIERSIVEEETDRGSEAKSHVYLSAFGKPAGHREVAPREFDAHALGGIPREKQKRKEGEEEEERKTKTKP